MDSVRIKVDKSLIKAFREHPEDYGDYVVILKNGMYTDVYLDDGEYYTITNDQALIQYLNDAEDHRM